MIKLLQTVIVFAVVVAVLGMFSVYGNGRTVDFAFADGHDGGGGDPPPDCCDAPPPDDSPPPDDYNEPPPDDGSYEPPPDDGSSEPPPDDGSSEPPPDGGTDEPPPDGGSYEPPPDGQYYEPPPDGEYHECTGCSFDQPPPDGGYFVAPDGSEPTGELYYQPPTGDFFYEPPPEGFVPGDYPGEFIDGVPYPDGGDYYGPAPASGFQGTFSFDSRGDFVFEGFPTFDGGPGFEGPGGFELGPGFDGPGDPGYFPDGDFHDFFNPGDFAPDLFVDTFRPDEFKGDFGDFFVGQDFQPGAFDQLFDPSEFRPDEFGSFFAFEDFKPGDFGEFATVGDTYVDFGGHFDQFWGARGEDAQKASDFFDGLLPGDFSFIPPEDLVSELHNLDYQGFQDLDANFVVDLFQNRVTGQELDLRGDQWAGAFSRFDVEDIRGFDYDFIAGAVHDFAPEDFLGIPGDRAFAMFEATFFGALPEGAPSEGGPAPTAPIDGRLDAGASPPFFDPGFFQQRLDEFQGQIGGFLGAMGTEYFDKIEDSQLVDMFGRIDFLDPDFDRTVLGGEDLGGIFGSLEHESLAALGQDQIMGAIGGLNVSDFRGWDPAAAFNVFDTIDFDRAIAMEHMGGLIGAMGPDQFQNIEGDRLVGLFDSFAFGGPGFDLAASGMDREDIAGMMGAMDFQHMMELGHEGMIGAIQHLDDKAMGAWDGGTAFDVFSTIGFEAALDIDQLEGIVANFAAEHIQQLGDNLGSLLGSLDFHNNGEVLRDFSFDTLGVLSPEDFRELGVQQLADLANTTGGDSIVGLDAEQLHTMIENIRADAFGDFDPSVVGGMFAGLDHDQISGFDHETMEAALAAAGADLLGGLGGFDGIAGANTAFNELADLADLGAALEQDGSSVIQAGVINIFGGNLFGSN